jgi:hypothetical protein
MVNINISFLKPELAGRTLIFPFLALIRALIRLSGSPFGFQNRFPPSGFLPKG